jgi:nitrate/nitrite transporter NarK
VPFVFLCGRSEWLPLTIAVLIAWGLCKGFYDANIFASVYDVIRPEARGTAAGFMNMIGWLGGGFAPVIIGYLAQQYTLGAAISMTAAVYVASGLLLITGITAFVARDAARAHLELPAAPPAR